MAAQSNARATWKPRHASEENTKLTTARAGKWTTDEDSTLREAVEKHNCKNWDAIVALVPGRTKKTVYL
jgi:hypothetical protein